MEIHWRPLQNGNGRAMRHDRPRLEPTVGTVVPKADVIETRDALIVEIDLPGHELEDIDVEIAGPRLTVKVERKLEPMPDRTYHRSERPLGMFARTFTLPAMVDTDRAQAIYRNGVLCIELPKREELVPRTIPVSTGD